MIYDGFLDTDLLPAQELFADVLKANDTWQEEYSSEEVTSLLAEFRKYPCMNDPTEGINERIARKDHEYPELLYVLANSGSCLAAAGHQNLNFIEPSYRFLDGQQKERMLAYEIPPYDPAFSRHDVVVKYQQLGCTIGSVNNLRNCLIIPKTDLFRSEGGSFWSRRYFGKFDVLAFLNVHGFN